MWPERPLQSLMRRPIQYGIVQTGVPETNGIPCVRVVDLAKPRLTTLDVVRVSASIHQRYRKTTLEERDLLFALRGDIGLVREVPPELVGANIHRGVARLAVDADQADHEYVLHVLQSGRVERQIALRANGSALKELPIAQLRRLPIPVPPRRVQERLANVLNPPTKQILQLTDLIAVKNRYKRGLLQRLLSHRATRSAAQNKCLPTRLGEILTESREPSSSGTHARKLTVKLYGRGVVAKADQRPGSANTQYYRRRAGQLVYSKLDFLNGAFGIIPRELDGYETTLDLPAFTLSPNVHGPWLLHLFSWPGFYKQHVGLAHGGRKARRVNPSTLLNVEIDLPPLDEQKVIANLLDAIDRERVLLECLRNRLTLQKRALLDKLIAGELGLTLKDA